MSILYGIYLHQRSTESLKPSQQKFVFQLGTFALHGSNERLSFNQFIHAFSVAMLPLTPHYISTHTTITLKT